MAHPRRFDEDDPRLARVREIALALPGAAVKVSHGRPAFHTVRVFCYYGGSEKVDGAWVQHPHCVLVLPEAADRAALEGTDGVFVPAYLGPSGWLGFPVPPASGRAAAWQEVTELIDASYRRTAGRRLVAELEARGLDARELDARGLDARE